MGYPDTRGAQDEALIERAKAGDGQAFDELYAKYKRPILNFIYRMIGNKETAEELTQETFVRVYMNLSTFSPKGKVSSWIYTIAGNLAKNELRDKKYFHDIPLETIVVNDETSVKLSDLIAIHKKNPEEIAEDKELQESIQKIFDTIPEKYRQVLVLCDVQELSYEEVASIIGCSVGTVASRLSRARAIFMKRFGADLGGAHHKTGNDL